MMDVDKEDPILDHVIHYVTYGCYPVDMTKEKKRAVRKRATNLVVDRGEVFLKKKERKVKVVTSKEEQQRILTACHNEPTSGHFGVTKTSKRVGERFYWKGMMADIRDLVNHCPVCQRMNRKIVIERPEMHPVPVKSPWHQLGMDFVGPISPPSQSGNRYILTVSDYFTKFGWAKALPTKEAAPVVTALRELFFIMGLPSVITTDQGREFHNQLNSHLTEMFGIDHRMTTPYHPQANGLDERYNQTLVNAVAKFAQESRDTWDERIGEVVYAYNTSVHESTKHTPFEVMFGRMAKLPIDFNIAEDYSPEEQVQDFQACEDPTETERQARRQAKNEAVKANITAAQAKQKAYYDNKHKAATCFSVGSIVLKKDFRRKRRRGGKLDCRWEGPYLITHNLGRGLFKLQQLNGHQTVERVNGAHLKRFNVPDAEREEATDISSDLMEPATLYSPSLSYSDPPPLMWTFYKESSIHLSEEDSIPPLPSPIHFGNQTVFPSHAHLTLHPHPTLSSTPVKCGGFFPEFFPDTQNPPSPITKISSTSLKQPTTKVIKLSSTSQKQNTTKICSTSKKQSTTNIFSTINKQPTMKTSSTSQNIRPTTKISSTSHTCTAQTNYLAKALSQKLREKSRLQKSKKQSANDQIINIDALPDTIRSEHNWVRGLSIVDEQILLSGEWLNDNLVNAAQVLIAESFPHSNGLQNTTLGQTMAFNIQRSEFVQVLHTGYGHWITLSTYGCDLGVVNIFDSLTPAITSSLKEQIAALLCLPSGIKEINVRYKYCQSQVGSSDCGAFALAFASAIAKGDDPSQYTYDQMQMRDHLHRCLSRGNFTEFPVRRVGRKINKITLLTTIKIYCKCRMPDLGGIKMAQCSKCSEWYHTGICVEIPEHVLTHKSIPCLCGDCN